MLLARFLSLRYWLRHRGAFGLSLLGIALGLAVFVAIAVANASVLASFGATLDAVSGKTNLQIVGGQNGLPDELLAQLRARGDTRIQASAPILSQTLFSPTLNSSLLILGVDIFSEADFRDYGLAKANAETRGAPDSSAGASAQSAISFLLDPRALAISGALARRHNLKIGSKVRLFSGARRVDLRVVQILDDAKLGGAFGGDFAVCDIAAAQENFGRIGRIGQIDLIVAENQIADVTQTLKTFAPPDATIQRPAQRGAQVANLLAAFQLNLAALSSISLFVGAFLIYNAIAIAVVRRRLEVGTLRALGAGRGQILKLFLLEAAVIGFFGSILGTALGLLLARFTLKAVSTTVSLLYVAVHAREQTVPLWLLVGAPLGGTLLSVISALPAAWEAGNTSPRAALQRGTFHQTALRWLLPMSIAGAVFLFLAWLLCRPFLSSRSVFFGFAAAFCTLGGFALLAPLFTLWGAKLVQRVVMTRGLEGALAATYLQRALGRSSLVIAALMVSLAMSIGLSVMVRSFRGTVADWVQNTVSADLYIAPATGFGGEMGSGLPREVIDYARAIRGVRAVDTLRSVRMQLGNQPIQIAANELPTLLTGERKMRFVETARGEANAKQVFASNSGVLVSERFKSLIGLGAGDTLRLQTPSGEQSFFIVGVFYDYTPDECLLYMPRPLYRKFWRDDQIDGLALYFDDRVSSQQVKADLERKFAARYQLTLLPNAQIRESVLKTFDQTFAVTYALQLIAVIVAAIGIFDTLIALLIERAREIATLRALGASARQVMKMTLIEFALIGTFAWVMGVAAGLCLAWQLIFVINRQFFGWTILWSLPLESLWQSLLLALGAALGAGILPARAAIRRNISEALQTE